MILSEPFFQANMQKLDTHKQKDANIKYDYSNSQSQLHLPIPFSILLSILDNAMFYDKSLQSGAWCMAKVSLIIFI